MGRLGSIVVCVLSLQGCTSVNADGHDRLFGSPDDDGAQSGTPGGAGGAGDATCSDAACGGTPCASGEGTSCTTPQRTPPCAVSEKVCGGFCTDPGPDNGCGDTTCTACPTVEHAEAACRGDACSFDCDPGFVENGAGCDQPPAACTDGEKNGMETDVDCGGSCPRCESGKACGHGADCLTAACVNGICATASCDNGVQDSAETDIDCGGHACPVCPEGMRCAVDSDCSAGSCTDSVCRASTCNDHTKDGRETSVDCGGDCGPCGLNGMCAADADCASGHCVENVCRMPCQSPGMNADCPPCALPNSTACCRADRYCGCALGGLACNF